jgi:hypothetical protein
MSLAKKHTVVGMGNQFGPDHEIRIMSSIPVALISAACIFSGALLGLKLQKLLPGEHLSPGAQDVVKLSAGMIATLTALVLGLLVSSAKSSFDVMSSGILQVSAKVILLDRTLAQYGPEAKATRDQLKRAVAASIENIWPMEETGVSALTPSERAHGLELVQARLRELVPQSDPQRQVFAQAQQLASDLSQTRWLLIEEAQNRLPLPLLVLLVFWLLLLFVSFGLFAPCNATVLTVLFVGACSVSSAIFLVLELNRPLDGFIRTSNAPMLNALQDLGQ